MSRRDHVACGAVLGRKDMNCDQEFHSHLMAIIVLLASAPQAQSAPASIRYEGAFRWEGTYDVDFERGLGSNVGWSGPGAPAYPTFPVTKGLTSKVIAGRKTIRSMCSLCLSLWAEEGRLGIRNREVESILTPLGGGEARCVVTTTNRCDAQAAGCNMEGGSDCRTA